MYRAIAEIEVIHCMQYYLRNIRTKCPDYYRKRRVEILDAAREVVDAARYKALVNLIEEMEGKHEF